MMTRIALIVMLAVASSASAQSDVSTQTAPQGAPQAAPPSASQASPEAAPKPAQKPKADVIFTDPPYNVPINGHVCGNGAIKHDDFAMASRASITLL